MHVVMGARSSGKTRLIERLCDERRDWLGFVNRAAGATMGANLRPLPLGCPCCTGRMSLQVGLVRALRDTKAVRALVELPDERHAASLEKALRDPAFALSVVVASPLLLPGDGFIQAAELDPESKA